MAKKSKVNSVFIFFSDQKVNNVNDYKSFKKTHIKKNKNYLVFFLINENFTIKRKSEYSILDRQNQKHNLFKFN